jgi:hypothetical protein
MNVNFCMLFLQVDVATQRGFIPVDERMRVIDANGKLVCVDFLCTNYLCRLIVTDIGCEMIGTSFILDWRCKWKNDACSCCQFTRNSR